MNTLFIGLWDKTEPQETLRDAFRAASQNYAEVSWPQTLNLYKDIDRLLTFTPDLIFMQLQGPNIISHETLKLLKKTRAFIVQWSGDVRRPFPQHYIDLGRQIDLSLFTNLDDVGIMKANGCQADYLQVSADHTIYKPEGKKVACPSIVFMGNNYPNRFPLSDYRLKMVQFLKKTYGREFGVYGAGWGSLTIGNLNGKQELEAEIYRSCKIAINCSHFYLHRYTSDRLFRIMFSGAFCLTKKFPEMHEYQGGPVQLCDSFNTLDELKKQIDFYLSKVVERADISFEAYKYVTTHCKWEHRIKELMKIITHHGMKNKTEDWTKQLYKLNLSAKKYCQYGESVIAQFIFEEIGVTNRFLVDIGAGGGYSNTKEFLENGWTGLRFDMDGTIGTIAEFIVPGNICAILEDNKCPIEFDFLSVDIDSFDYDVIDNVLKEYSPRLVCAEFNGTLEPDSCIKLQYEPNYIWDGTNKYGFSFGAGVKLFKAHGYTVIFNSKDTNIFAVRNDLLPPCDYLVTAKRNVYHPINKAAKFIEV